MSGLEHDQLTDNGLVILESEQTLDERLVMVEFASECTIVMNKIQIRAITSSSI